MQAHCQHSFKHRHRRLHMRYAVLHGPGGKARDLDSIPNGDREILMPSHLPVCLGRLVEKQTSDQNRFRSEHLLNKQPNTAAFSRRLNQRNCLPQIPQGVTRVSRSSSEAPLDGSDQVIHSLRLQYLRNNHEAVLFKSRR